VNREQATKARIRRRQQWYPALLTLYDVGNHSALALGHHLGLSTHDMSAVLQRLRVRGWVKHDGAWIVTPAGIRELVTLRLAEETPKWRRDLNALGAKVAETL
jgi:hypothetical protein